MNKNKNNPDTEHVLQLAAKFEPKSVREMSVEEYESGVRHQVSSTRSDAKACTTQNRRPLDPGCRENS